MTDAGWMARIRYPLSAIRYPLSLSVIRYPLSASPSDPLTAPAARRPTPRPQRVSPEP